MGIVLLLIVIIGTGLLLSTGIVCGILDAFRDSSEPKKGEVSNTQMRKKMPLVALIGTDGKEKKGPQAFFMLGELVVVKNRTYRVAYLNEVQVTLKPVEMVIGKPEKAGE